MRWKRRGRKWQGQVGLGHQHGARRHVDRLADTGCTVRGARGRSELDEVGAERRRSQQQGSGVAERSLHTRLEHAAARAQRAAEDHAVLGGLVDLVQAEALLQSGDHLQRLGDGEIDGDRLDPAEGGRDQGARRYLGDGGGHGDAHGGAELDDGVRRRDGGSGGEARGEEGERHPARDHGGVDADLRPELVDGVVDRVRELVQRLRHRPCGLGQVAQPAGCPCPWRSGPRTSRTRRSIHRCCGG